MKDILAGYCEIFIFSSSEECGLVILLELNRLCDTVIIQQWEAPMPSITGRMSCFGTTKLNDQMTYSKRKQHGFYETFKKRYHLFNLL